MSDAPYSVRELKALFATIDEKLDTIHEQTVKTNGRVNSLERWQSYLQGGMAIIVMLLVPILLYTLTKGI
jgi:hypothetical protein